MAWHGYILLTFTGTLGDGLNENQKSKALAALRELNQHEKQTAPDRRLPHLLTSIRWSLKGDKCIVEAELPDGIGKGAIVDELVKTLGLTRNQLNAVLDFQVFLNSDDVVSYVETNRSEWVRELLTLEERRKQGLP